MSWKDWLRGKRGGASAAREPIAAPCDHPLIPGKLSVRIEDRDLAAGDDEVSTPAPDIQLPGDRCRCYLTRGLADVGQREVMFMLAARGDRVAAVFEQDVLNFLGLLYQLAGQGQTVDAGDVTVFGQTAPFGLPGCGLAYLEPARGIGPPVPDDALLALFLRPDEAGMASTAGVYRVAAWIARAYRVFPYPRFSDPSRPTAMPPNLHETALAQMPRSMSPAHASAILHDKTLTLRLGADVVEDLRPAFSDTASTPCLGIVTGPAPDADSRLVWMPKASGPSAIGVDGSSLSRVEVGFVAFAGGQEADEAMLLEDGVFVQLRSDSWLAVKDAVESTSDVEISLQGTEESYVRTLHLRCGASRAGESAQQSDPRRLLTLLNPEDDIRRRIDETDFMNLVRAVCDIIQAHFREQPPGQGFDLQVAYALLPGEKLLLELQVRPEEVRVDSLERLRRRLEELPRPQVSNGPIAFARRDSIRGGAEASDVAFSFPFASLTRGNESRPLDDVLMAAGMAE